MDALILENNIFNNIKSKQTCSELRVSIKYRSASRCSGATVGLICSTDDRYLSLHTRNSNSICRVVILAQKVFLLCSQRAVELPHRLHSPHPKPQQGHLILQLYGREVKIHCGLPDQAHFFHFLLFRSLTRKLSADLRHSYYEWKL